MDIKSRPLLSVVILLLVFVAGLGVYELFQLVYSVPSGPTWEQVTKDLQNQGLLYQALQGQSEIWYEHYIAWNVAYGGLGLLIVAGSVAVAAHPPIIERFLDVNWRGIDIGNFHLS